MKRRWPGIADYLCGARDEGATPYPKEAGLIPYTPRRAQHHVLLRRRDVYQWNDAQRTARRGTQKVRSHRHVS